MQSPSGPDHSASGRLGELVGHIGACDNIAVMQSTNLPVAQSENFAEHFIGVLSKQGRWSGCFSGSRTKTQRLARHEKLSDTRLIHILKKRIVIGAVDVFRYQL